MTTKRTYKILAKRALHEGFTRLYEYQLEESSLTQGEPPITITREVLHGADTIIVLVYAPDVDSFLLLRETRLGVYCNADDDDPFIYECVAGNIDPGFTPEEAARREVLEEAGQTADKLEPIAMAYASPGRTTEKSYLFYTEIPGKPVTGTFGLAEDGERIVTQLIKRDEVYRMMDAMEIIDGMTLTALSWFRAKFG